MTTIRWGVLGAANFAREHMAPAIHAARGAELAAIATRDPHKAEGFRAFAPGLRVHAGYQALLDDPEIDAIYIPLPNDMHVEWSLKALEAGKHVLCEKPIAMQADQIDALIAACDARGLVAAEAFMILHHPQWQRARDWVQSGEIGELVHADAAFSFHLTDLENIRNRPETGGGGLRDIGVYTMGSMRYVTGAEPAQLEARLKRENGIDTYAHVWGTMAGGAAGQGITFASTTSMRAYKRQVVTFQGTRGMVRLEGGPFNANLNDMAKVELHTEGNRLVVERFPGVNHYVLQVENFGRAIAEGMGNYPVSLEFSKGTQAMMDLAYARGEEIG